MRCDELRPAPRRVPARPAGSDNARGRRLPGSGRRRVQGLRREELALLPGVSTDYLVRLEQGRDHHPSTQVLDALTQALRLDTSRPSDTAGLVGRIGHRLGRCPTERPHRRPERRDPRRAAARPGVPRPRLAPRHDRPDGRIRPHHRAGLPRPWPVRQAAEGVPQQAPLRPRRRSDRRSLRARPSAGPTAQPSPATTSDTTAAPAFALITGGIEAGILNKQIPRHRRPSAGGGCSVKRLVS